MSSNALVAARCAVLSSLLLTLTSISPPAHAQDKPFAELMGEAIAARKSGDLKGAALALEAAYKTNPSPELYNNLGRVYESLGQYIKAYDIYLAVSNDPQAERSLRALDASRMAALQPKIGVAWVVTKVTPVETVVLVDGRLHEGPARDKELATGPGRTGVELRAADGLEVTVRVEAKLPVGERTTLEYDATAVDEKDARLNFEGVLPVGDVYLDGYKIGTDLALISVARVTPGVHVLELRRAGFKPETHDLDLHASAEVMISGLLKSVPAPIAGLAPWRASKGPWITGGAGGLATAIGAGFLMSASSSQAEIDDNTQGGAVTGISQARAQELNDTASAHGTLGNSLLATGLTALVGGAIWYFIDQSDAPEDASAPEPTPTPEPAADATAEVAPEATPAEAPSR